MLRSSSMKTVFITGVSRGIGKALAQKFLKEGYRVIGTSRAGSADFTHSNLIMLPLDLAEAESRQTCVEQIRQLGYRFDVWINNAGIWDKRDMEGEIQEEPLRGTLEVNLIGTILLTESLLSLLEPGGHLLNISSRWGSLTGATDAIAPSYRISKAALNMYTRELAARLKGHATVSCVHPGSVHTDMNPEGPLTTQEATGHIFSLTQHPLETGQFWYEGKRMEW